MQGILSKHLTSVVRAMTCPQARTGLRHMTIPALVYAAELVIWARLIHSGVADDTWATWRTGLIVGVVILILTGMKYCETEGSCILLAATGVIFPWIALLFAALVYGFIQMNLSFLTPGLFFIGVLASGALQVVIIVVAEFMM